MLKTSSDRLDTIRTGVDRRHKRPLNQTVKHGRQRCDAVGRATNNNGHSHPPGCRDSSNHQKNALTSLLNQQGPEARARYVYERYLRFFSAMKREKFHHPKIFYIYQRFQWLAVWLRWPFFRHFSGRKGLRFLGGDHPNAVMAVLVTAIHAVRPDDGQRSPGSDGNARRRGSPGQAR